MAGIFVSYTSSDRDWAFWIGHELQALGHEPHLHEWEIPGGGDIAAWMEKTHDDADHILCVISIAYLAAPYSSWERRAAVWATANKRPGFALPVLVEACEVPTLLAHIKRCDLYGLDEAEAKTRLTSFLMPARKPTGHPSFPGAAKSATLRDPARPAPAFPPTVAEEHFKVAQELNNEHPGRTFTAADFKQLYRKKYPNRNEGSIMPADYSLPSAPSVNNRAKFLKKSGVDYVFTDLVQGRLWT